MQQKLEAKVILIIAENDRLKTMIKTRQVDLDNGEQNF